ncbi:MAG TPA: hypothetical protein VFD13_07970 [Candidatus Kapabacteria bacterium]|nr:hypothetical protein [Candidatus Kapabacteria bacterium]
MKTFYTVVTAILALLASSMPAMAQGVGTTNKTTDNSDFSLGTGLLCGAMNSQVMVGAYLDAAIGEARIDLNIAEEITSTPSLNFVDNLPNPEPSFKRISLTYGREIFSGLALVVLAAGPEYTWGIVDGKYLYSDKTSAFTGLGTDHYESSHFTRVGLALDANVDVPVSRHFAFGLRSSLTIDNAETYGLFGMTFGYVFH